MQMMNYMNNMNKDQLNINHNYIPNSNNNNLQSEENNSDSESGNFSIYFMLTKNENKKVKIECKKDELIFRVIERFREKENFKEEALFMFNYELLNLKLTVEECGLKKNSCISIISR